MTSKRLFRALTVTLMAVLITACAPWSVIKVPATKGPGGKSSVELPVGWRKLNSANPLMVTRDGFPLNMIRLQMVKHKRAFRELKKYSSADMLPQELAENYVAELKTQSRIENIEILKSDPATVGGRAGFMVHLAYRTTLDNDAIRYQMIVHGAATQDGLYLLSYEAPVIHYFARDVGTFERVAASFKL